MNELDYSSKEATKLVDGKITGVFVDETKEHWGFTVKKGNNVYQAWVNCDTEGNGPGHILVHKE